MDVGPSGGFLGNVWNNIRQNLPGMINAVGSSMPGSWGQASQATGKMMPAKKKGQQQPGVNPSNNMPSNPFNRVQFGGGQPMMGGQPGMQGNPNISPMWSPYMAGGGFTGGMTGMNRPY